MAEIIAPKLHQSIAPSKWELIVEIMGVASYIVKAHHQVEGYVYGEIAKIVKGIQLKIS